MNIKSHINVLATAFEHNKHLIYFQKSIKNYF